MGTERAMAKAISQKRTEKASHVMKFKGKGTALLRTFSMDINRSNRIGSSTPSEQKKDGSRQSLVENKWKCCTSRNSIKETLAKMQENKRERAKAIKQNLLENVEKALQYWTGPTGLVIEKVILKHFDCKKQGHEKDKEDTVDTNASIMKTIIVRVWDPSMARQGDG